MAKLTKSYKKKKQPSTLLYSCGIIFDGKSILVVGGKGFRQTEKCVLGDEVMICSKVSSGYLDDNQKPALFLTDENYCDLNE